MAHKIEWTEQTWNPSVGCAKISSGCKYCYAESMAVRLQAIGVAGYENGFRFNRYKRNCGIGLLPVIVSALVPAR